jgi:hypothetical protein
VVDCREWVAQEEASGAWIRLDWGALVVVEIKLYDRPSPPKPVRWILFRIDRAQGSSSGLAEIMVYGTSNP